MRKALQAEQSKAEKLLQLASLEKRCMEKENEINELRRRIIDKLEEEQQEKEEKEQEHERDTTARQQKNTIDLKSLTVTLRISTERTTIEPSRTFAFFKRISLLYLFSYHFSIRFPYP